MNRSKTLRIGLMGLAILLTRATSRGQEPDPMEPTYIRLGVNRADAIVIGAFKVAWFYPWIDGWHYRGVLDTDEVLLGDGPNRRQIAFFWLEKYGNECLICERISQFDQKSGIWLLIQANGRFRFSGLPLLCAVVHCH